MYDSWGRRSRRSFRYLLREARGFPFTFKHLNAEFCWRLRSEDLSSMKLSEMSSSVSSDSFERFLTTRSLLEDKMISLILGHMMNPFISSMLLLCKLINSRLRHVFKHRRSLMLFPDRFKTVRFPEMSSENDSWESNEFLILSSYWKEVTGWSDKCNLITST